MIAAIIAMVIMIVAVDQLFWRPIVVWSQRFKLEEQAQADAPQSWVLNVLTRSRIYQRIEKLFRRRHRSESPVPAVPLERPATAPVTRTIPPRPSPIRTAIARAFPWVLAVCGIAVALWGAWVLVRLLIHLPWKYDRVDHADCVILALLASFLRTTSAVALGAAWALPVGILIGLSPTWSRRLQPIIQVVASFPAPMLFPLVTLALTALHVPFTIGCTALMLLGAQWYILFNVIAGASAIPQDLKEVTQCYRSSAWERWVRLYIPCVFPYLVTGLITAAGGAWNATIVSEFVQVKGDTRIAFGLGSLISGATAKGNFPLLAAGVVTMAIFVVLLNRFFWKRLYRLSEERYSLNV